MDICSIFFSLFGHLISLLTFELPNCTIPLILWTFDLENLYYYYQNYFVFFCFVLFLFYPLPAMALYFICVLVKRFDFQCPFPTTSTYSTKARVGRRRGICRVASPSRGAKQTVKREKSIKILNLAKFWSAR